jgi:hypothetical protein
MEDTDDALTFRVMFRVYIPGRQWLPIETVLPTMSVYMSLLDSGLSQSSND